MKTVPALEALIAVMLRNNPAERQQALFEWVHRWVVEGRVEYRTNPQLLQLLRDVRDPDRFVDNVFQDLRRRLSVEMPAEERREDHPDATVLRTRVVCLKPE